MFALLHCRTPMKETPKKLQDLACKSKALELRASPPFHSSHVVFPTPESGFPPYPEVGGVISHLHPHVYAPASSPMFR